MATASIGDEPGAVGWLIGDENRGLACMFTMMNNARLAVGIEGVADGGSGASEGGGFRKRAPPGQGARLDRRGHEPDRAASGRAAATC
jgi:acyl-CoA dehydrogenase